MPGTKEITVTIPMPDLGAITWTAPLPETLTQHNVEAITGVPAAVYLKHARSPAFPLKVSRLGKLRIVDRAAFVAWLLEQDDGAISARGGGADDEVEKIARLGGLVPSKTC